MWWQRHTIARRFWCFQAICTCYKTTYLIDFLYFWNAPRSLNGYCDIYSIKFGTKENLWKNAEDFSEAKRAQWCHITKRLSLRLGISAVPQSHCHWLSFFLHWHLLREAETSAKKSVFSKLKSCEVSNLSRCLKWSFIIVHIFSILELLGHFLPDKPSKHGLSHLSPFSLRHRLWHTATD